MKANTLIFDNFAFPLSATLFAKMAVRRFPGSAARIISPSKRRPNLRAYAVLVVVPEDAGPTKGLKLAVKTYDGIWRKDLTLLATKRA